MSWTDERVEMLKRMWTEGASASQIAKELGGVTRNAVIGKVHRLGLSNRTGGGAAGQDDATPAEADTVQAPPAQTQDAEPAAAAAAPESRKAKETAGAVAEPDATDTVAEATPTVRVTPANEPLPPQPSAHEISPEAIASVRETEKKARKLSLQELTERTCKWPIGDPATEEFWFCGLPVQPGKPYCEAHVGVAFQPMSSRRDRRR